MGLQSLTLINAKLHTFYTYVKVRFVFSICSNEDILNDLKCIVEFYFIPRILTKCNLIDECGSKQDARQTTLVF